MTKVEPLRIERASDWDIAKITRIKIRAYNDDTRRFGHGRDGGPPGYDKELITKEIMDNYGIYLIYYDEDIIGCFYIVRDNEVGNLADFCIDPAFQNRGYGLRALELMEDVFGDIRVWRLSTIHYSIRNQRLFEKFGYRRLKIEDDFMFHYEKHIKQ